MKRAEAGQTSRPGSGRWAAWCNICRRWYIWTHSHWQAERKGQKNTLRVSSNFKQTWFVFLICTLKLTVILQLKKYDLFIRFVQYPVYQWLYIGCYINDVTVNIMTVFFKRNWRVAVSVGRDRKFGLCCGAEPMWRMRDHKRQRHFTHLCIYCI